MPFDGVVTRAAIKEIKEAILGGHVRKINQIGPRQLTFQIYAKGKNVLLYLSADPSSARIQLTEKRFKNPDVPPNFVMLLRKHIGQAEIRSIDQYGLDRTVRFCFSSHNELGDPVKKYLIAEMMGKYSNLILLNEEEIVIDAIQRVSHAMSRVRQIFPGVPYQRFPSDKLEILSQEVHFQDMLDQVGPTRRIDQALYRAITGFSPALAREICFQADLDPHKSCGQLDKSEIERLEQTLQQMIQTIRAENFSPCLYQSDKVLFYCLPLHHLGEAALTSPSLGKIMDVYYDSFDRDDRQGQLQSNLLSILSKEIEKESRKLDRQRQDYEKSLDRDKYKEEGDLLASNLHRIQPGDREITVSDYYHEGADRVILLDPGKSAWENVEKNYKRFSKLKKSNALLSKRLPESQANLDYLLQLRETIEQADSLEDLQEIREEFTDQGLIQKKKKNRKKVHQPEKLQARRFLTSTGKTVYVGRNNRQNDQLTLHMAGKDDYFFHSQQIPGAHVILITDGKEPSEQEILEAAWLAARYSSGRGDKAVDIDYTARKNVYKAKGAKPGMVYYRHYKTITVNPQVKIDLRTVEP